MAPSRRRFTWARWIQLPTQLMKRLIHPPHTYTLHFILFVFLTLADVGFASPRRLQYVNSRSLKNLFHFTAYDSNCILPNFVIYDIPDIDN